MSVAGPTYSLMREDGELGEVSIFVALGSRTVREPAREDGWGWRMSGGAGEREYEIPVRVFASHAEVNTDSLLRDLEAEDLDVRLYAARILGEARESRAFEPLIQALDDQASGMRALAAEALGRIGDQRAVQPLIVALEDEAAKVRAAAV